MSTMSKAGAYNVSGTPVVAVAVDNDPVYAQSYASAPSAQPEPLAQFQNEGGAREFLTANGFPTGLQDTFIDALTKVPLRFFILDDSGSMGANDGKRIVQSGNKKALVQCSRWAELTEALQFHINFARSACAPTEFRFLNSADPIKIGYNDAEEPARLATLMRVLDSSPTYGTPLCRHIREVIAQLRQVEGQLRATGQKACLIIATDGEASDGNIAEAMAPLKDLPVWVVVRLCTDEEKIVNYWNSIDEQLELSMDVLDDLCGEASEVHEKNPWLTYGEPIQRLREFGIAIKELDLLDERKLSPDEVRRVARIIFGGKVDDYPHPEVDFHHFAQAIEDRNAHTAQVWDPVQKRNKAWLDKKRLAAAYGPKGCTIA